MESELVCFGPIWWDDILSTVINSIALIVNFGIGLTVRYQSNELKKEDRPLGLSFYSGVIASCICSLGGIGQNLLCLHSGYYGKWTMIFMSLIAYCILPQCTLGAFIQRLEVTFRGTWFEMAMRKAINIRYGFVIIQLLGFAALTVSVLELLGVSTSTRYSLQFSLCR